MAEYVSTCKKLGYTINPTSSKTMHESFMQLKSQVSPRLLQVIMWLGTAPMATAKCMPLGATPLEGKSGRRRRRLSA
jgi:hypothetical protein